MRGRNIKRTLLHLMPRSRRPSAPVRLGQYRPALDRTLFVLALFGFLVVVHLALQDRIGFSRGCIGIQTSEAVESSFNCELVTKSESGMLLGVSNIVWGFAFYITVALLGAAVMALPDRTALLKRVRAVVVLLGFAYALFLVSKQVDMGEYCALCLTSAFVTTLLFFVLAIDYFRPSSSSTP